MPHCVYKISLLLHPTNVFHNAKFLRSQLIPPLSLLTPPSFAKVLLMGRSREGGCEVVRETVKVGVLYHYGLDLDGGMSMTNF